MTTFSSSYKTIFFSILDSERLTNEMFSNVSKILICLLRLVFFLFQLIVKMTSHSIHTDCIQQAWQVSHRKIAT